MSPAATPGQAAASAPLGAPRPTLRSRDVLALTVGIVIGAGIFRTPALVAGAAGSEAALLLAWVAGGLLSIVGALCYAELVSAFPHVGGDFHFLDRAYGPRLAFLYAWARLAVIQTGSIALLAYVLGDYLAAMLPIGPLSPALYAAAAVLLINGVNWAGIRLGARVQRWLTAAEVAGLALVIAAAFTLAPAAAAPTTPAGGGAAGLMMVFVLLTYGGWSEAVYVSAEVEDAPRRMGRIMVAGLAFVTLLYVLANLAFLRALGLGGMAASEAVAAEVMRRALGGEGVALISLIVAIAAFTSANATAITGARTACALGRSFAQLRWLGRWDVARDTPANALVAQTGVALLLVAAGAFARDGFRLVVEYTAPVFWFFLLLVGLAVFVLRIRQPHAPRPFRVPLYPLLPALFCLTSAYLLYASVAYTGAGALAGIAVLAAGGLALALLRPSPPEEANP
ncbi:MAG TPA: amino acid permease [Allosphingosinicella sp.]|nr:amino acid permease [Allosphingosinicella sp.]